MANNELTNLEKSLNLHFRNRELFEMFLFTGPI